MGEGSTNLTDPHHTPTFIQPSTQPQKTQKPKKPKRKDTQVPQPSDPTESVADEAVYKELGDSLVRVATTASSLEAERDSDNINNTQSKATPNESSFLGTTLESLGEDASKQGMIDAIDADEEITLVNVQNTDEEMFDVNVLDGEEVFVAEQEVAANKEVNDEVNVVEEVVEDAAQVSVAGNVVSTTGDATTVSAATTTTDDDGQRRETCKRERAKKEANIALIETWDDLQAKIGVDHQLVERLQAPEQEELSVEEKATLFQQLLEKRRKHFAAKRAEEKRNKRPTKAQQRKIMCTYQKNMEGYKLQDLKLKGVGGRQRKESKLIQESAKKQKVEDDKETAELKQCLEIIPDEEEVTIDAIPLVVKSPSIVGWKIHKEGRKSYYQIIRADGKSQMYMIFSHMLKSFNMEDLEDLYKLVKAKYESTTPVEDLDLLL
ncbi:hypothetical protein Tco_1253910 [Tanacetum coccineum]